MQKSVIILGSGRSFGDTRKLCDVISTDLKAPLIDLKTKTIGHYDYDFKNQQDDFPDLISEIIHSYDCLVFATPVYWYSMSGRMKVFFDRLSDLLLLNKDLGRQLRGKQMAVISCGSDGDLKEGFYMPFIESASYLGMSYRGSVHGWVTENGLPEQVENRLLQFSTLLKGTT